MRQAPKTAGPPAKLVTHINNNPTGRQQPLSWRRAWFFAQAARDAHQAGDNPLARHLLRDAKQSFKEI